ncbi:MAG: hypothetical protein WA655_22855 [Candidatus Korobacteraceae bacterium]
MNIAGVRRSISLIIRVAICALGMVGIAHGDGRPDFREQWKQFRRAYPYHIQVMAISPPAEDRHRLLIISEPPPHVTFAGLRDLDPAALSNVSVEKNLIGFNGWTKDILVDLPPQPEAALRLLLDSVAQYLFVTNYKSYILNLPVYPRAERQASLDIRLSAADMRAVMFHKQPPSVRGMHTALIVLLALLGLFGLFLLAFLLRGSRSRSMPGPKIWIFFEVLILVVFYISYRSYLPTPEPGTFHDFVSIHGGAPMSFPELLVKERPGVFVSVKPGLILWSFTKTAPLARQVASFRQFALDSDLILGAVEEGNQVIVVARERRVPVDILPPLRAETMLLLASGRQMNWSKAMRGRISLQERSPETGQTWIPARTGRLFTSVTNWLIPNMAAFST